MFLLLDLCEEYVFSVIAIVFDVLCLVFIVSDVPVETIEYFTRTACIQLSVNRPLLMFYHLT